MNYKEYLQIVEKIKAFFLNQIKNGAQTLIELSLDSKYYNFLKPYAKAIIQSQNARSDIVFVYMLSQFTLREYSGSDYYHSFCASMKASDVDDSFFRDIIKATIKTYGLLDFGYFNGRGQYVECVKALSFSYYAKQDALLYSTRRIYEWLGCNIQDKEIVKRELYYIQQKTKQMAASLKDDKDVEIVFGNDRNGKKAPRLYLAVSTFRFFSYVSIDVLMRVYYPILQLIDNWYYPDDEPNHIPQNRTNWIESSYEKWIRAQNANLKSTNERKQKTPYRNHTPSFWIDPNTERDKFKIVIPEITKEAPTNIEKWFCEIRADGKTVVEPLELSISEELSFENAVFWKTSQVSVPLDWSMVFSDLSIIVYQSSDDAESDETIIEWTISKNAYRLFDANGYQIKTVQANKENILLLKTGNPIEDKGISNIRKSKTLFFDKVQFLASSEAAIKIGNSAIISVAGQYYSEPFFAEERDSIIVEKNGVRIKTARKHPDISIRCSKGEEDSILVTINGTPRRWLDKNHYKVIPDVSDSSKIIVTFSVESFIINDDSEKVDSASEYSDGIYDIEYGVSGKPTKSITYFILQSFAFRFSRPRFYDSSCELKATKEYLLIPKDSDSYTCTKLDSLDESYWQRYNLEIKPQCESVSFYLEEFDVTLNIPVKKAVFWFNSTTNNAVFFRQQTSIPFTQIENTLNVIISGAQAMDLQCNGKVCNGQVVDLTNGVFRFDLSEIRVGFHDSIPGEIKIKYVDTKTRETVIRILSIKPWPIKWCLTLEGNIVYNQLDEIATGASCFFDIYADESDNSLIESIPLSIGERQKLMELESNKTYWYRRRMTLPSVIPGLPNESFFIENKRSPLPFIKFDIHNLVGVTMDIYDGKQSYFCQYTVHLVVKKASNEYLGYLYENGEKKYAIAVYDLVEKSNSLSGKIACYLGKEKCCCQLALRDYQLVRDINRGPNDYYYSFDRNSFRRGE